MLSTSHGPTTRTSGEVHPLHPLLIAYAVGHRSSLLQRRSIAAPSPQWGVWTPTAPADEVGVPCRSRRGARSGTWR